MTRSGDYETYYDEKDDKTRSDLYNRMDLVNSIENSVLISIHQNHFEDSEEHGTQIWYSANTAKSKVLADSILQCIKSNLQSDNKRENKESGSSYYLLYKAKSPSIMVECGFVSNPEENKLLQNSEYQQKWHIRYLQVQTEFYMASKQKSLYVCQNCGYESVKWYGKCPTCGEWNTMEEQQPIALTSKNLHRQEQERQFLQYKSCRRLTVTLKHG